MSFTKRQDKMTTTSLKLPEDLKRKAIAAAQDVGVTPQEFMVDAIRQAVVGAEQRVQFIADAKAAHKEMLQTGVGYDAKTVHAYLRDRLTNADTPPPDPKPWRP